MFTVTHCTERACKQTVWVVFTIIHCSEMTCKQTVWVVFTVTRCTEMACKQTEWVVFTVIHCTEKARKQRAWVVFTVVHCHRNGSQTNSMGCVHCHTLPQKGLASKQSVLYSLLHTARKGLVRKQPVFGVCRLHGAGLDDAARQQGGED